MAAGTRAVSGFLPPSGGVIDPGRAAEVSGADGRMAPKHAGKGLADECGDEVARRLQPGVGLRSRAYEPLSICNAVTGRVALAIPAVRCCRRAGLVLQKFEHALGWAGHDGAVAGDDDRPFDQDRMGDQSVDPVVVGQLATLELRLVD